MNKTMINFMFNIEIRKKILCLFLTITIILSITIGVARCVPVTEYIDGLKIFLDGIYIKDPNTASIDPNGLAKFKSCQVNGLNVATLDANSLLPIANTYPPETTVELDDDETLTLPAITRGGILNVWTSTQYAEYFLKSDGSVEYIRMTAGCDDADTDAMTICVYKDGTVTKLKNTSGGTLTYGYTLIKN